MSRVPPEDRPSARELAAQSSGGSVECPKCGCRDWRTVDSRPGDNVFQVRRKRCRNCGYTINRTEEVAVPKGFRVLVVPEDEAAERSVA